jgi:hypothetical protein
VQRPGRDRAPRVPVERPEVRMLRRVRAKQGENPCHRKPKFEGSRLGSVSPQTSPPAWLPLMRFAALKSLDMRPARGVIGFPTPAPPSTFPPGPSVPTGRRPRVAFAIGSSSRELHASSECSRSPHLPGLTRRLPWDCPSLFAVSVAGVLATSLPRPIAFPPSAFLTPSAACSACALVGLFHPTTTSRVPGPELLLARSRAASSASRALSTLPQLRCRRLPAGAASPGLALRALLHARVRAPVDGV